MTNCSNLEVIMTSWNELPYLKCLLPQFLRVFHKVHIVDDFSTDGTVEWVKSLNDPRIDFTQRKFDTCAGQFDYILQRATKDNTWIWCATPDEFPTKYFFENIRKVTLEADAQDIDRIWTTVFHLRGERDVSAEVGGEIRLFRNDANHQCRYIDFPHERLDGKFDGHCSSELDKMFAFVHFKQADEKKIELWKTDYVEKGVYSAWDINRRLKFPSRALPEFIQYEITDDLRRFLGWLS